MDSVVSLVMKMKNRTSSFLQQVAFLALLCAVSTVSAGIDKNYNNIFTRMIKDRNAADLIYPYESNYLLFSFVDKINVAALEPYEWAKNVNKSEIKFNLSVAFPVWREIFGKNTLLGISYTQGSWWQAFNSRESAPFRENNYEPQVFLVWAPNLQWRNWTLQSVETGINHQSNGRDNATSRSWNRIYMRAVVKNGNFLVDFKPWFRVPEKYVTDDNPGITSYIGHYRLKLGYKFNKAVLSTSFHQSVSTGRGGGEVGLSYPVGGGMRFYTQVFTGYGESMIDYNYNQGMRVGIGFMWQDIL